MASVDRMTQNFFLMTTASPSCTPQTCPRRAAGHRAKPGWKVCAAAPVVLSRKDREEISARAAAAAHNLARLQQRAAPSQEFARSQKCWRSGFGSAFTEASGLQEAPRCSLTLLASLCPSLRPAGPAGAQPAPLGSQRGRCSCPGSASQPFTHGFSSGVTKNMDPGKEKGRGLQGSSSAPLLASKSHGKSLVTSPSVPG